VDGWKDMTSPICVHLMHIMQITHIKYKNISNNINNDPMVMQVAYIAGKMRQTWMAHKAFLAQTRALKHLKCNSPKSYFLRIL
jgi:hypothetical protein